MAINLKSNEYWGKRSGNNHPEKGRIFIGKKYANGKEGKGTPDRCKLINIPHRYFKK